MRITEAAQRLGTSPRMLRYREQLGLLPAVRQPARSVGPGHGRPPTRSAPGPGPGVPPGRGVPAGGPPAPGALASGPQRAPRHRQFGDHDLTAVALALRIEQRYDISPAALAFGLRVLADAAVRADVAELGRRIGRISPPPARALEFEKERALRLLSMAPRQPGQPRER